MKALSSTIKGQEKLLAKLRGAATSIPAVLLREMKSQMARAADWSRANKLSGDPLNRRSGRLSRSVTGDAHMDGTTNVVGTLSSNVPYAHVHENGGTFAIPAHTRRPPRSKTPAGHFRKRTDEQRQASVQVSAHKATFPQRAFLRPSLVANKQKIIQGLYSAAIKVMK